jgi:Protein of unknown function (DUF2442)
MKHRSAQRTQLSAAELRGVEEEQQGASAVAFDVERDAIVLTMRSGIVTAVPRGLVPHLGEATGEDLAAAELSPNGTSLSFPRLDLDYSVRGLLREVFGFNGQPRRAAATTSPARAAAARRNGKRGGRPKKTTG